MKNDQVTPQETAEILRLAEQCLGYDGDFVELGCYRGDTSVLLGKLLQKSGAQFHPHNLAAEQPNCGKLVDKSSNLVENTCETSSNLCKTGGKTPETVAKSVENSDKHLWIYDSFEGLPPKTSEDSSGAGANFQAGELLVTKREVVAKIRKAGLHNVIIKKAWFDNLADNDLPVQIAFAFLDGDLYGSIKTSLKLVAPRLTTQGIMIVHDYNNPELPGSSRAVDEFLRAHPEYRLQVRYSLAIMTSSKSSR